MEQDPNSRRRILFVGDEQSLIETTELLLEKLGEEVRSFFQSKEALGEFEQDPSAFDGVISNINVPDMNGIELAKKLMAARPDIAIMLITGNSAVITEEQARENRDSMHAFQTLSGRTTRRGRKKNSSAKTDPPGSLKARARLM